MVLRFFAHSARHVVWLRAAIRARVSPRRTVTERAAGRVVSARAAGRAAAVRACVAGGVGRSATAPARSGAEPRRVQHDCDASHGCVPRRDSSVNARAVCSSGEALIGLPVPPTDRQVLVGTIDEVVVAYLELALGTTAVVEQVYVDPEARELGLGDDMLAMAIAAARQRGCVALEGTALPGDRLTKNLYERAAITTRKLTVWTAL